MWTSLSILFILIFITRSIAEFQVCGLQKSVELTNRTYNGVFYEYNEYFVDNVTGLERGCVCLKGICARKCCPTGMGYNWAKRACVELSEPFNPPVWDESATYIIERFNITKEFVLMYGKMSCEKDKGEERQKVYPATRTFRLLKNGKLYVYVESDTPPIVIYEPDKYCIDTFIVDDEYQLNALICYVANQNGKNYAFSSSCMLVSCFFILLTVVVYASLPELRNLHGMVMIAYLLSFFVGLLFLAIIQIFILREVITQKICTYMTFIIYFAFLAAFCWLNVMCYDIWWTFSGKRALGHTISINKRFVYYSTYAFSVPTALTIILAACEFCNLPLDHPLRPKLRIQGCFLHGNSKLLFLYGPLMFMCIANMIFFTLTAIKIAKIKKDTAILRQSSESATNEQNSRDARRFTLYIKLFVIMGISWILEIISSIYPQGDLIWQFSDTYNMLVGLVIFIIFVCKKKTLNLIKNRYVALKGRPISSTQTLTSSEGIQKKTIRI